MVLFISHVFFLFFIMVLYHDKGYLITKKVKEHRKCDETLLIIINLWNHKVESYPEKDS